MKSKLVSLAVAALLVSLSATPLAAETKVQVKGLHNCCGACLKGITGAVKSAGATAAIDAGDDTVTITAADKATVQQAIDALAAAGYHGTSDNSELAIKDDSGAPAGKVQRLELSGAHNCCKGCAIALDDAAKSVSGVTGSEIKPKTKSFIVEGDFEAAALIKALNEAGFHVKVAGK